QPAALQLQRPARRPAAVPPRVPELSRQPGSPAAEHRRVMRRSAIAALVAVCGIVTACSGDNGASSESQSAESDSSSQRTATQTWKTATRAHADEDVLDWRTNELTDEGIAAGTRNWIGVAD